MQENIDNYICAAAHHAAMSHAFPYPRSAQKKVAAPDTSPRIPVGTELLVITKVSDGISVGIYRREMALFYS
jgi:hypothetical protein